MQANGVEGTQLPTISSAAPVAQHSFILFGILKIAEVVCNVLVLILANCACWSSGALVTFVGTVCLCGSSFFFFLHYKGTSVRYRLQLGWNVEFWSYLLYTLLYLASAVRGPMTLWYYGGDVLVACVVFLYVGLTLYCIDTVLLLVGWRRDVEASANMDRLANGTSTAQPGSDFYAASQ